MKLEVDEAGSAPIAMILHCDHFGTYTFPSELSFIVQLFEVLFLTVPTFGAVTPSSGTSGVFSI